MQIPTQPPPLPTTQALDTAKTLPQLQAQAAAPVMTQRAISASKKSDRGNQTQNRGDQARGGDTDSETGQNPGGPGGKVNIRV